MQLALFDLDHTLLPIDSDYEWGQFLVRIGAVDAQMFARENERFFRQYQDGSLDIHAYAAFAFDPLVRNDAATLAGWHARFMDEVIRPQIRPAARALVARHRDAGALTALVTATNDFVTAPIAREFGIEHLIATRAEHDGRGYTGRIAGTPAFREGKVARTDAWLAERGLGWNQFDASHFYSDSANDIPLMERVSSPVATNPDARLRAHAQARGWPVIELFA